MKTSSTRIQVTPSREAFDLVNRLSEVMGKSRSLVIAEILQQALPALEMTIQALEVVQKHPEAAKALIDDYAARSINSLTQSQMDLSQKIRQKRGPKPKVKHA